MKKGFEKGTIQKRKFQVLQKVKSFKSSNNTVTMKRQLLLTAAQVTIHKLRPATEKTNENLNL